MGAVQETGYILADASWRRTGVSEFVSTTDKSILQLGVAYESDGHGFMVCSSPAGAIRAARAAQGALPKRAALLKVTVSGRGWHKPGTGQWAVPFITATQATALPRPHSIPRG